MARLELVYGSREALSADHAANLSKGRAFVPGSHAVVERERCELAIAAATGGRVHVVFGEIVWIGPNGVGLALALDAAEKAALAAFVAAEARDDEDEQKEERDKDVDGDAGKDEDGRGAKFRNVHERVRALTPAEREEVARRGSLPERVALERAFGGSVWEALLSNPQLTVAEVARIAKNGTVPKPLVNLIVGNAAWLASSEVQRALLSNPRCSGPHLDRVLLAMKPSELAKLAQACPYRPEVRSAVLKRLKR